MKRKNTFLEFCKDFWWLIVLTLCSLTAAVLGLWYIDSVWYARVCLFIGAILFGALFTDIFILYAVYTSDEFND